MVGIIEFGLLYFFTHANPIRLLPIISLAIGQVPTRTKVKALSSLLKTESNVGRKRDSCELGLINRTLGSGGLRKTAVSPTPLQPILTSLRSSSTTAEERDDAYTWMFHV